MRRSGRLCRAQHLSLRHGPPPTHERHRRKGGAGGGGRGVMPGQSGYAQDGWRDGAGQGRLGPDLGRCLRVPQVSDHRVCKVMHLLELLLLGRRGGLHAIGGTLQPGRAAARGAPRVPARTRAERGKCRDAVVYGWGGRGGGIRCDVCRGRESRGERGISPSRQGAGGAPSLAGGQTAWP